MNTAKIYTILVLCLIILSCNSQQPTRPIHIHTSNSDTTKPIASYYLTSHNIHTGPYKKQDEHYTTEGSTKVHGNTIHYKLYGNANSEWTKLELTIHITSTVNRYPSKYQFAQMTNTLYKRAISRKVEQNNHKRMILTILSERFDFIHLPLNKPYTHKFFGKITDKRFVHKDFQFVKHILDSQTFLIENATIVITKYPTTTPYTWKEPYNIRVTMTPPIK